MALSFATQAGVQLIPSGLHAVVGIFPGSSCMHGAGQHVEVACLPFRSASEGALPKHGKELNHPIRNSLVLPHRNLHLPDAEFVPGTLQMMRVRTSRQAGGPGWVNVALIKEVGGYFRDRRTGKALGGEHRGSDHVTQLGWADRGCCYHSQQRCRLGWCASFGVVLLTQFSAPARGDSFCRPQCGRLHAYRRAPCVW